jgi:hypothetical protein
MGLGRAYSMLMNSSTLIFKSWIMARKVLRFALTDVAGENVSKRIRESVIEMGTEGAARLVSRRM